MRNPSWLPMAILLALVVLGVTWGVMELWIWLR